MLQKQFDEEGQGVVVNSIHPGTKHSKILQQSVIPLEVRFASIYKYYNKVMVVFACLPGWGLRHRQLRVCAGYGVEGGGVVAQPDPHQVGGLLQGQYSQQCGIQSQLSLNSIKFVISFKVLEIEDSLYFQHVIIKCLYCIL